MNPDSSTLAAGGPVDLDVSKIEAGQQVVIRWRERPIFVFHRTPQILQTMQDQRLLSQLADPNSTQVQQGPMPSTGTARSSPSTASWSASARTSAVFPCSIRSRMHRRRPPTGWAATSVPATARNTTPPAACSQGSPAPYNLPVPPYRFVSDTTIRVGENPTGSNFDFGSIRQL
jgi:ubiquinol-cytochrome c reductase iron-sulfur subunit